MDAFEKKTLKTSRGYTYTYYTSDGDKSLPALFFQHGWPDHAQMCKQTCVYELYVRQTLTWYTYM